MRKGFLIILLSIFGITASNAEDSLFEQNLADITNGLDASLAKLGVYRDKNGDIAKIFMSIIEFGEVTRYEEYTLEDLKKGVVLKRRDNRDIVILRSDNLAAHNGGHFKVIYLYSGITNNYRYMNAEIVRSGNEWSIDINGRPISSMYLHIHRKRVIGVIGIKRISFQYANEFIADI